MSKKIAILGGGVAGMSAAHELIKRGFQVEVYDRNPKYVGGKARSIDVPGTDQKGKPLPGEHGFRFFPGFYEHITDTLKDIPTTEKPISEGGPSVFENFKQTRDMMMTQADGRLPIFIPVHFPSDKDDWKDLLNLFGYSFLAVDTEDFRTDEMAFFITKLYQLFTSCPERFEKEYEYISWMDFIYDEEGFLEMFPDYTEYKKKNGKAFSNDYMKFCVEGLTRSLVACRAEKASLKTVGSIALQLFYLMFKKSEDGKGVDNVFNAPTNDAWLNPWLKHLKNQGVVYHHGHELEKLVLDNNIIAGAKMNVLNDDKEVTGTMEVTGADYYILAVPVEIADKVFDDDIAKADLILRENVKYLAEKTEWMNGIMFYLNKKIELNLYDSKGGLNEGHSSFSGSKWSVTSICQAQFWDDDFFKDRGNGDVVDILSVDVSDWKYVEGLNGKLAFNCSKAEVVKDVWEQIKGDMPPGEDGKPILTDDMLVTWFVDDAIIDDEFESTGELRNEDLLLVNEVGTWEKRPNAYSNNIKNLMLASDYVKTNTDLASMEGANEAARRAVNRILELEGVTISEGDGDQVECGDGVESCRIFKLYEPAISKPFWDNDRFRLERDLPWNGKIRTWWTVLIAWIDKIKKILGFLKAK